MTKHIVKLITDRGRMQPFTGVYHNYTLDAIKLHLTVFHPGREFVVYQIKPKPGEVMNLKTIISQDNIEGLKRRFEDNLFLIDSKIKNNTAEMWKLLLH